MKLCGIYLITHAETGMKYVGQSVNINHRYGQHSTCTRKTKLANAIRKHGWQSFKTEILELCDRALLNENESKWINFHNCIAPNGYNLTTGGGQCEISEITRAKIAKSHKGRVFSDEHRANISAAKTNPSAEIRAKISFSSRNRSAETLFKIGSANRGKKLSAQRIAQIVATNTGKTRTEATKSKMSASQKGRTFSDESRAKMSASHTGQKLTDAHKAKISASTKGRKQTIEHVARAKAARAAKQLLRNNASVTA